MLWRLIRQPGPLTKGPSREHYEHLKAISQKFCGTVVVFANLDDCGCSLGLEFPFSLLRLSAKFAETVAVAVIVIVVVIVVVIVIVIVIVVVTAILSLGPCV